MASRRRGPARPGWPAVAMVVLSVLMIGTADAAEVDFDREIRPLLAENCFQCHGGDATARQADLRLDQQAGVVANVTAGRPARSRLFARITSNDPERRMPPPKSGHTLSAKQIETIRLWIVGGAGWSEHWAFRPVVRPEVPAPTEVNKGGVIRNPIDQFVIARRADRGLPSSQPSGPERLIRRVTLDLTGLPPRPAEVEAVVTDFHPGWYERLVDRLLASPRLGEHLARHWLDLARYADTDGYQDDEPRVMWRWRDWVIEAINHNKPFDEFTIEQLAGDLLPGARAEQILATGFNRNNRTNGEGGSIAEEFRVEYIVDRLDTLATTWMGLTLSCARCHDHKYDPISQREFFRLFAFFNNVPEKGTYRRNSPPLLKVPTRATAAELSEIEREESRLPPGDSRRKSLEARRKKLLAQVPSTMVLSEGPPRETFLLIRGRYDQRGEKVTAGVPRAFPDLAANQPRNRLGLARWLVDRRHPLTSRVAVNRLWQQFFGRGLVETPEDFGVQGSRPSHPLLLDWLAAEFQANGWDVKRLLRVIVCSHTYRQSSRLRSIDRRLDPDNRWLARSPRLRLSAEMIRDQALWVSGLLVEEVGGASVKPYQPAGLWKEIAGGASGAYREGYRADRGSGLYRRSLYTFWRRTIPPPTMATFDAPSRENCTVRRGRTNTPLQALALMNDTIFVEAARQLAVSVADRAGGNRQIERAFRLVLGRRPRTAELAILVRGFRRSQASFRSRPEAARRLLALEKFTPAADPSNVASRAALLAACHVILNLDEAVTRE